ncbi:MAG: matrixin family metalloprotease [Pseudomonadota bacterium]
MFELLNVKWGEPTFGTPSGTVTWSSDLGGNLVLDDGATDASIDATLERALQTWEDVAAVTFVEDNVDPDFTIGAAPIDVDFAGVAIFRPDQPGLNTLDSGEIFFNSQYVWSDTGGPESTDFFAVAVHEIGHMIGLDHPDDPTQIMNAIIQVDELGQGDIEGAQVIYGTDGDDEPVETTAPPPVSGGGGGGGGGGGLVLGLLAVFASLFTGGAAFVAMAAGRIAGTRVDDDPATDPNEDLLTELTEAAAVPSPSDPLPAGHFYGDGHDHGGGHMHGVAISEFELLPGIDFTQMPNPCGCIGLCEHIIDPDECQDSVLL